MPRREEIKAREERAHLQRQLSGPRFALVTTEFRPHRRQDVAGRTCPCCGSEHAIEIGREDDLTVLVDLWRKQRRNAWEVMTPAGRDAFADLAAAARPWGTQRADVVHVPIVYTCPEDAVEQLRDDVTETIYWSGGWRGGKTFRLDQWWSRGWVKFGGSGILFWLVGPELKHAFRMMEKIFLGRGGADGRRGTPSILPMYTQDGQTYSMVAPDLPASDKAADLTFEFIDGAKGQLNHTRTVRALEGEDVQRIAMDEVTRMSSGAAYKICRGRVTQCGGQVGMASVPDDEGAWVYDEVVAPVEAGTGAHKCVHYVSSYLNCWLPIPNIERLAAGETDPVTREQKIEGRWTRHGMYEYRDVWQEAELALEVLEHSPEAWGFAHDITPALAREIGGRPAAYLGAHDFNERPQTALLGKVFGNDPKDWRTWVLVWLAEQVLQQGDARQSAAALRDKDGGRYQGAVIVCDANGFWDGHRYGGRASKTSDAYELEARGFVVVPAIRTPVKRADDGRQTGGGEPQNPGVPESRRLVRQLLADRHMLFAAGGVPLLRRAMPKVPYGRKPRAAAGTALDRQVFNLDDCARYLAWRIWGARLVAGKPTAPARTRGAPRLGAR